jgi:hypothetical protein
MLQIFYIKKIFRIIRLAFKLSNQDSNEYQNGNKALCAAKLSALPNKVNPVDFYGMDLPFLY